MCDSTEKEKVIECWELTIESMRGQRDSEVLKLQGRKGEFDICKTLCTETCQLIVFS